jgi:cysteine-rich repeat protein
VTPDGAVTPDTSTTADSTSTPDASAPPDTAVAVDSAPLPDTAPAPDTVPAKACGNGKREGTEQCDDGNKKNLDGCDASCKFEQNQRINWLKMQYTTDAYCTSNAFGGAMVLALVRTELQKVIDGSIKDGEMNVLFRLLGLDDLSGTSDPALSVGVLSGTPTLTSTYDGTSDLDWWYVADGKTINAQRLPVTTVSGKIAGKVLTAGPGSMIIPLDIGGTVSLMGFADAKLTATVGSTSKPLTSSGSTPGHLASEHLSPTLVSFASTGVKTNAGSGKLCGEISAASLAAVPVPSGMSGVCAEGYGTSNSMLDVLVGGCTMLGFLKAVAKTQPDGDDSKVAPAGAGPKYKLVANAKRVVTQCLDKSGKAVNLQACLKDATYSTYLRFATGRVIIK